uniref:Uncharacterized protein n=1 Tax=uncultured prokaryote TaxID=198431 RepID=A0A0H5Q354_9ZZZZ|nr:hypothetical protein [uncultured prokaryote]
MAPETRTVQHQFTPHPQSVKIEVRIQVRPDKGDFLLWIEGVTIKGNTPLWQCHQYFPRDTAGMQSVLAELNDCLFALSDQMDVIVAPIALKDLNEVEF